MLQYNLLSALAAILVPPAFSEKLKTTYAQEREPVRLVVRVSGEPPPTVSWYRDGNRLVSSPDFQITQDGDVHGLYIPEVFYEDTGKISVRAENPAGEAICSAHLYVQGELNHRRKELPGRHYCICVK